MIFESFLSSKSPKQVIVALHGWTGYINSMKPIAKLIDVGATKWILMV